VQAAVDRAFPFRAALNRCGEQAKGKLFCSESAGRSMHAPIVHLIAFVSKSVEAPEHPESCVTANCSPGATGAGSSVIRVCAESVDGRRERKTGEQKMYDFSQAAGGVGRRAVMMPGIGGIDPTHGLHPRPRTVRSHLNVAASVAGPEAPSTRLGHALSLNHKERKMRRCGAGLHVAVVRGLHVIEIGSRACFCTSAARSLLLFAGR
jgi:hypothetical protein